MIDWSIRIGDIVVVMSLAGTSILYAFKSGKFAESIENMKVEITEMKDVAREMSKLLTTVAVQSTRLDTAAERLNMLDRKIEDLRRGSGWITKQRSSVDGEYP